MAAIVARPHIGRRQFLARKQPMYDWFPIVFIVFKVVVLGVGMFFAIKWHHDQAKKDAREKEERERAAAQKQTDDTGTP